VKGKGTEQTQNLVGAIAVDYPLLVPGQGRGHYPYTQRPLAQCGASSVWNIRMYWNKPVPTEWLRLAGTSHDRRSGANWSAERLSTVVFEGPPRSDREPRFLAWVNLDRYVGWCCGGLNGNVAGVVAMHNTTSHPARLPARGILWPQIAAKALFMALMRCILGRPFRRPPTARLSSRQWHATVKRNRQTVIAVLNCEAGEIAPKLVWKTRSPFRDYNLHLPMSAAALAFG
jgi:hypothetical protein